MHFQDVLMTLERFWADRGCIIQQPYDLEVGAGTFNPATMLGFWDRSLGTSLMWSLPAAPLTVVTAKIPTGCSIIINIRSY